MALSSEDATLVAGIMARDEQAACLLYQRFGSRIATFARKQRVPSQDCDDIVQEVLTDAIRQLQAGRFREGAALSTWLYTIMGGKVANYWRKHMRERRRAQTVSLDDVAEGDRHLMATNNSDAVLAVRQALSRLSSHDQLLLLLSERHGHTLEEIGSLIGFRKSAVGEHLAQARERFRIALNDGGRNSDIKRLTD